MSMAKVELGSSLAWTSGWNPVRLESGPLRPGTPLGIGCPLGPGGTLLLEVLWLALQPAAARSTSSAAVMPRVLPLCKGRMWTVPSAVGCGALALLGRISGRGGSPRYRSEVNALTSKALWTQHTPSRDLTA